MPLSRKGLALLYYLALEGPTSRMRLADLLYGHAASLQNLRVELHRLAQALGRPPFPKGQDPLVLPPWILLLKEGQGEALGGLEAVGGLEEWVQGVRMALEAPKPCGREALLEALEGMAPPGLLVLRGRLGSGAQGVAQELARRRDLPYRPRPHSTGLVYLEPPYPEEDLETLLRGRALLVLWLLPGEEPRFFLELRARYGAERTWVVDLPPLTWAEARKAWLQGLPFSQAAGAYFLSGGQPEWLPEFLSAPKTPRRPLAQLELFARLLPKPAREALERLAQVPGFFSREVAEALEAAPHLAALERKGWLVYDPGRGYRFAQEAERRLLATALPPGERERVWERLQGLLPRGALPRPSLVLLRGRRGRERASLPPEGKGVDPLGEGWAVALLNPGENPWLAVPSLGEEALWEVRGEAWAPEDGALYLGLRSGGREGWLALGEGAFALRLRVPAGPFRLGFRGLGVVEFTLGAYRLEEGEEALWALPPEEEAQKV
ncbi:hypothetical protein [Thermus composti]|uniref:hypothetical protein n=1 Tax=Thermus composti TaxID=532059 RepID=UPI001E3A7249|nr:hypothetical protein [Thermus composti]